MFGRYIITYVKATLDIVFNKLVRTMSWELEPAIIGWHWTYKVSLKLPVSGNGRVNEDMMAYVI
jgi:hypothetical protein